MGWSYATLSGRGYAPCPKCGREIYHDNPSKYCPHCGCLLIATEGKEGRCD